uniref:STAS domain-containing protein n=1 Tax=uncultured Armatimonadetes bacterium TaxID=157466 RepID=A0A6J4H626_9BACT|nr:hypothetical protein AVDCRST_MAG63-355 [uncultured Armatimonadetes bacterium]
MMRHETNGTKASSASAGTVAPPSREGANRGYGAPTRPSPHAEVQDDEMMDDEADSGLEMEADGDTLRVRGDIDLYQAQNFRQLAAAHLKNARAPHLDLIEVTFIDSAGLAALLALSRQAHAEGKRLRLSVTGSPRRVLRITGIDRMLELED